jgi:hypothetical protein
MGSMAGVVEGARRHEGAAMRKAMMRLDWEQRQRMATIAMRVRWPLGRPATMQEIVEAWHRAGLGDYTPQGAKSILDDFVPLYRDEGDRVRRAW